jgi:hypothetical protein
MSYPVFPPTETEVRLYAALAALRTREREYSTAVRKQYSINRRKRVERAIVDKLSRLALNRMEAARQAADALLAELAPTLAPRSEEPIATNDKRVADRIDGYDRDDLGESPDY